MRDDGGAEDFVEIRRWGLMPIVFLPYKDGIPNHDTLNGTINALDGALFAECFGNWGESLRDREPDGVAIDGKTSRRTMPAARVASRCIWSPRGAKLGITSAAHRSTSAHAAMLESPLARLRNHSPLQAIALPNAIALQLTPRGIG